MRRRAGPLLAAAGLLLGTGAGLEVSHATVPSIVVGAHPALRARHRALLLQRGQGPKDADFFGAFSEAESTHDADVQRVLKRGEGYELQPDDPNGAEGVRPAAWYHESQSGGPRHAWQTHYPQLATGATGRDAALGPWVVDENGRWVQEKAPPSTGGAPAVRKADWFEASARQEDGFGRPPPPLPGTGREFLESSVWAARRVNTTLACKDPGCTATVSMQAFDGLREQAAGCTMSLFVHPTDFDDQYSGERVTRIRVNGHLVQTDCYPMVSGCGRAAQATTFACVRDLPLDHILNESGALDIEAAISDVVDECPYKGNLLAAVPVVSCLVAPSAWQLANASNGTGYGNGNGNGDGSSDLGAGGNGTAGAGAAGPVIPRVVRETYGLPKIISLGAPFRCPERGCSAVAELNLNQTVLPYRQCLLTVTVNQTDFDADQGTDESIQWLKVNEGVVLANVTPGHNPCRAQCNGRPLTAEQRQFVALAQHDITNSVSAGDGRLRIEVKISDYVDECAYEGYLLSGYAFVTCNFADHLLAERPAA